MTSLEKPTDPHEILVIGARGFLGSAMVRDASARGHRITAIGRGELEAVRGREFSLVVDANGNSRKFLASRDPALDFEQSVGSVMQSLFSVRTDTYLYLSSSEVYRNRSDPAANCEDCAGRSGHDSAYGFHKLLAEELVKNYAPNWLILRLSGFVGEGLWKNAVYDILAHHPVRVSPDSEYQFMNTNDLASIAMMLWEAGHRKEIFNVAARGTIPLKDIIDLVPGYGDVPLAEDLPVEQYELNTEKLSAVLPVPENRPTVTAFVQDVQSGRIRI